MFSGDAELSFKIFRQSFTGVKFKNKFVNTFMNLVTNKKLIINFSPLPWEEGQGEKAS